MLDPTDLPNADGAPAPTAWQARREWRMGLELANSALRTRDLHAWPQGDGHPVIVLPGFLAGPESTVFLRSHLRRLGYRAHDWRQGRNLGASPALRRDGRGHQPFNQRRIGKQYGVRVAGEVDRRLSCHYCRAQIRQHHHALASGINQ